MTTKSSGAIAATRQKIFAQISTAQKQADAAKKAAKNAKAGFKQAKQKFKEAKRAVKTAKKAVRVLKSALEDTAVAKSRSKSVVRKAAPKPRSAIIEPAVSIPKEETIPASEISSPVSSPA